MLSKSAEYAVQRASVIRRPRISNIPSTSFLPRLLPSATFRRNLFGFGSRKKKSQPLVKDKFLEEYKKKRPEAQQLPVRGDLSSDSIFADEGGPSQKSLTPQGDHAVGVPHDRITTAAALDPEPERRKRWERRMVIKEIRSRGLVPKQTQIRKTERESLTRSPFYKTSVKKLGSLARQIAGKPIDDAIIQMKFSKKKAAKFVREQLEHARNEAVVRRGMGLGDISGESTGRVEYRNEKGNLRMANDKTDMYVEQTWVGRGKYNKEPDFKAMGRTGMIRHPETSISVLLKEEATRVRQYHDREERLRRRRPWVQLANKPVSMQRPYYCW